MSNYGVMDNNLPIMPLRAGQQPAQLVNNDTSWLKSLLDKENLQGIGSIAGGMGSLFGAYNGFQQMRLAKEALDQQKKYAALNLANQANLTNQDLRNREMIAQGARGVRDNEALQQYMNQNAVRSSI